MNLADTLASPPQPEPSRRDKPNIPNAGDPGTMAWDGTTGVLNTQPVTSQPLSWDAYIREAGLDPAEVEVVGNVGIRGWQIQQKRPDGSTELVYAHYYKLDLQKRRTGPNIDDLLKLVKRRKPRSASSAGAATGPTMYVGISDTQIGKMDGDGATGTIERTIAAIDAAAARRKRLHHTGPVLIGYMGDGCEGFVSQGGSLIWRTKLTLTEQIRVLRRIMLYSVDAFAGHTDQLTVVGVPGNHDQAVRQPGQTRSDDSHDLEALISVSDALKLNADAYGHVTIHTPDIDGMGVTLTTANTIVGFVHGHQWRPGKQMDWLAGQAFGDQPIGQADVLMYGHWHHLRIESQGKRMSVGHPALEAESVWWKQKTGIGGNPGLLTGLLADGRLNDIAIV